MASNTIDAKMLAKMFLAGAKNLESKKEWINELNVFPVPDGDTGTNMTLTIMSAAKELITLGDNPDMESLCKAVSGGSLRGARGNSGVILSQLLRGFTRSIKTMDTIDIPALADAFERAVETAYKAVMKPKEGTILTVARSTAEKARELCGDGAEDMEIFLGTLLEHARYVLSQTPELLPVLKQAGVVDSGGQGLVEVLSGAYDAYLGKEIDYTLTGDAKEESGPKQDGQAQADIRFGYCTEFIILLSRNFNIKAELDFKAFLESIGDSIVCVTDDDVVKVHVHTNDPGLALQRALKYGALSSIKIDNMRLEHQEKLFKESEKRQGGIAQAAAVEGVSAGTDAALQGSAQTAEPDLPAEKKDVGFVAVSIGDGMNEIFRGLGVDYIIEGGQTMNPSTADMLEAIEKVNADTVFILPNNSNVILAANQAVDLVKDKKIIVLPTRTVPQGITAVINYVADLSPEENAEVMTEEIGSVRTGEVTYAVRDTCIDDKTITQGDYMGIGDKGILTNGTDLEAVTLGMVDAMMDDEVELISIYYGIDVKEEDAEKVRAVIAEKYSACDVELQFGGQPIYYYVISAE